MEGAVLATVTGEVDMSNSRMLGAAITENTPNEAHIVILDLSAVTYLDSAGIQLVYSLRESLRVRGQDLRLVVPTRSAAHDTLRLAGVVDQIPTAEDAGAARSSTD